MRKLVLHLAIACATFAFSTSLTNIWRSLTQADVPPAQTVQLADLEPLSRPADEAELLALYREYGPAQTRHDQAFFEKIETDDFMLFVGEGQALTRTEDIKDMNNSPTDTIYTLEVQKIDLYGSTAIVTCTMTATGQGHTETWPTVDICVKREGRWQIRSTTDIE
jgi:hypothetical protein